ncbi:MAG TPA: hypothetical protein VF331_02730 [Polyangiales bacterium]
MKHVVEILFFKGCPNVEPTREVVRAAIEQTCGHNAAEVVEVEVRNDEQAKALRFLGSPTVRVDEHDVDAASGASEAFGLQCRVYRVGDRLSGTPPIAWIAAALREG